VALDNSSGVLLASNVEFKSRAESCSTGGVVGISNGRNVGGLPNAHFVGREAFSLVSMAPRACLCVFDAYVH
jgi:hypothetical protein